MTSTGSYFPIKLNADNIQHELLFHVSHHRQGYQKHQLLLGSAKRST